MLVFSTPAAVAQAVNAFLVRVSPEALCAEPTPMRHVALPPLSRSTRADCLSSGRGGCGIRRAGRGWRGNFGDLAFAVAGCASRSGVSVLHWRHSPVPLELRFVVGSRRVRWVSGGGRAMSLFEPGVPLLVALASTVTAWLVLRTAGSQWRQSWLGCAALCAATFLVVTLAERVSTFRGRRLPCRRGDEPRGGNSGLRGCSIHRLPPASRG